MSLKSDRFKWMGISDDGETAILRKFHGNFPVPQAALLDQITANPSDVGLGAVLDVETTGLDRKLDVIIELGIRKFRFRKSTGQFIDSGESMDVFQDPGFALSPEIVKLTGLTNDFLRGHSIDWNAVAAFMQGTELVIAHNAGFDRPFVDRMLPLSRQLRWGCSLKQLNWKAKDFPSSKLDVLSLYHGFFTDAHRALNDADALLYLLTFEDAATHRPYLTELLKNSSRPFARALATGSPFETKDLLRARGYQWDPGQKVWHKMIYKDEAPQEIAWMEAQIYQGKFRGQIIDIPVEDNFK